MHFLPMIGRWSDHRRGRTPWPVSERICGDLRLCRDPLPFAELIGVGQRTVTEAVARDTDAANGPIDPMQHSLVIDVNDARVKPVGDTLSAGEVFRDDR